MTQSKRPLVVLAAALAAIVCASIAWVGPVGAQTAAAPTPDCSGFVFKDSSSDQGIPQGAVPIIPAGPNLDITGVFFRYDTDAEQKTPVTVNIQVTDLSKDLPLGGSAASWYAEWTVADVIYYAKADLDDAGAITYDYGVDDPNLGLTSTGPTTGKFFEGPGGIVQIRVPQAGTKANDGSVLKESVAHASVTLPGLLVFADNAPDAGTGKNYTVAQCPGAETTTPPPATTSTVLPVKLITSSAKASKSKTKAGKSLSFKLQSTEQVTGLKATFKKGSTSYGTGKLATLNGNGTLKVKLKKALKKGSYKLKLTGTTAGGARSATYAVKVK